MERIISLAAVQETVKKAYERYKDIKEGTMAAHLAGVDPDRFGICMMLTDGTVIEHGDVEIESPMGSIAKIGTAALLLQQNSVDTMIKKLGYTTPAYDKPENPKVGLSMNGVRAVSLVTAQNDTVGKWNLLINNLINMMGSAPVLDDRTYESIRKNQMIEGSARVIEQSDYKLYDDADISLDLYTRLISLKATARQLAVMGATVAADGRNPLTGQYAYDGALSQTIVTMMVLHGPRHTKKRWLMEVGLPSKRGMGGFIIVVMPGLGAIATYSPMVDEDGISIKGARAIRDIANELQLNVFASARVRVEK